jgi:putative PIN family toxin of toxin-antitoxin system
MTSKRRFIFDTNVIVSALLFKQSVARQAFDKARAAGDILLSVSTLEELSSVLRREKFNKYLSEAERLLFLVTLVHEAVLVEIAETITECRDPKDNKFLELAVSGHADCVISGDEDLTSLHPFREIPVLTPREFLDREQD